MTVRYALQDSLSDLARCLRFYSRLPVPRLPWETDPHPAPDFATMPRMLPFAGAILGSVAATALAAALWLGLGPSVSAALAITILTLATGAFHEDGLADTADSLGGATRERRLEIMKDSRIGAFGASALILGFALRISALATLAERLGLVPLAGIVILVAAVSRTAALTLLTWLPPARSDGASYVLGRPTPATLVIASVLAAALAFTVGTATALPVSGTASALLLSAAVAVLMTWVSARLVRGQTGDLGGATQQLCEIAGLLAFLAMR
jgi:adenosylcobinamide-GDP ribazoletransferase